MLQSVQTSERLKRVTRDSAFPSAEEIRLTAFDATSEESVLRRLHAPFSYLDVETFAARRDTARAATRCVRTWIFDEPEVAHAKRELADLNGMSLSDFAMEYLALLGESCSLQRRIADALSRSTPQGSPTYVRSIHDAATRPDRAALFDAALTLFLDTYAHEQRRFAFGSSLKRLVERELNRYPSEWHALLLTSTRGDFWSRYEQDLLDYVDHGSVPARERLVALYFGADTARLNSELTRVRSLPDGILRDRRQAHRNQRARLASQHIRKGYATLGDFPRQQLKFSRETNANITEIDRLLWVDNVLEKFIDHKQLLHHDLFLRLHLARLAVASQLGHPSTYARLDPQAVSDLLGVAADVPAAASEDMHQLIRSFGSEAIVFAQPDTRLATRLMSIRRHVANAPSLLANGWAHAPSAAPPQARCA